MAESKLPFTVLLWDQMGGRPKQMVAEVAAASMAFAAYYAAISDYPDEVVVLHQRGAVIAVHPRLAAIRSDAS